VFTTIVAVTLLPLLLATYALGKAGESATVSLTPWARRMQLRSARRRFLRERAPKALPPAPPSQ
ncbi:MAG: hypothetical protein AAGC55_22515, partial [Myxococcota bacterium]